jgi:hypothetical protein
MRETEGITVLTLREGHEFLMTEKRVLIRIFGVALNVGRESASNCNSASLQYLFRNRNKILLKQNKVKQL